MFAYVGEHIPHTPSFTPQRGGELNPKRLKGKIIRRKI
jgi:hypothetical protein